MGHSYQALNLEELWDEVEHLNQSVSALQTRLAQVQQSAGASQNPSVPAPQRAAESTGSPWDVWPYIWAIDLYHWSANRFHSFHEKLFIWRLAAHNRRVQILFRRHVGTENTTPRLV